ncbi:MAG: hypothetical protein KJ072_26525, partial [Verrucomicrobia bacterium]|nr:hypothetical protein [Verrucomicrobiota bacterium]
MGELSPEAMDVVALAGGETFCLGLRASGTVVAWGPGYMGETNVPPGLWNVTAVAAGGAHGLALRSDGTVAAWGDNGYGQTDVPAGLSGVVAIAAGGLSSLALRADGSLVGWGGTGFGPFQVPPNLPPAVAIAVGGNHALALRADGQVVAWGDNSAGQTVVPADLTNVVTIAAGGNHSLALTVTGSVVAWGDNTYGQRDVPPGLGNVIAIAAGHEFSLALKADGTVAAWGANYAGQTEVPAGLTNVGAVAAGGTYGVALRGNRAPAVISPLVDRVAVLGLPVHFRVSVSGAPPLSYQWQFNGVVLPGETNAVLMLPEVRSEQAGWYTLEVRNAYGIAYSSAAFLEAVPLLIVSHPRSQTVFWGSAVTLSVEAASSLPLTYQWHFNGEDRPGATGPTLTVSDVRFSQTGFYAVTVANDFGSSRSADATLSVTQVAAWGDNIWGQTNVPSISRDLVAVAANHGHSLALQADGRVLTWGDTVYTQQWVPAGLDRVAAVAAGVRHDLALRDDGTVVAWGVNTTGQTNVPVGLADVVLVAAGWDHSLALKSDGTVVSWGGTGALADPPPDLRNVVSIAAADSAALALRADGTVVVWGNNRYQTNVPPDLTNAVAIAAGSDSSAALTADGRVVAWGSPASMTNVPVNLSTVLRLDTSGTHHLALQADGTPIAWGGNAYGETSIPAGLANVADVAAGDGFSVALAGAGAPYVGAPLPRRATPYGMTAWLRCVAVGEPPMSYQWRLNGEDLPGANDLLLTLPAVTFADEGRYSVVVSNGLGRATNTVELAVPPLLIVEQPHSQQLLPGATATFRVTASSALPLSYQWNLNGLALPGATNSSLLLTQVQPDAAGDYEVEVRNALGSVRSVTATLSLTLVMAWGTNALGQLEVPAGLHDAVALGSGDAHGLAVKADGTVVAWGDDRYGQTRIPVDLTNAIAVAGGAWHSVALRADGRVTAWGDNRYGQTNVPPFLDQVVAVAAGSFHSLALRADGTVVGWGDNRFGKANPPAFLSGVVAIAAGSGSSLALRSDGTIVTWTTSEAVIPAPGAGGSRWTNLPPTQAVAISSRGSQHVAIRPDGTAQVWGSSGYGGVVAAPAELSNLVAVAAGTGHFLALQEDGVPATWGARTFDGGWLPSPQSILQLPEGLTHIAAIAAGSDHSLALGGAGPPVMTSLLPYCAVVPGRTGYLHAAATGGQPLSYQWRFNGMQIVGATRATLALTNVQPDQAGDYSVVVSNPLGSITNAGTRVEVIPAFLTALSPDQSTFQGGTARFQVAATGAGPLSYQWQFDGTDLAGATDSVLQLDHVQAHQAGFYTVGIGNAYGTLSSPA